MSRYTSVHMVEAADKDSVFRVVAIGTAHTVDSDGRHMTTGIVLRCAHKSSGASPDDGDIDTIDVVLDADDVTVINDEVRALIAAERAVGDPPGGTE